MHQTMATYKLLHGHNPRSQRKCLLRTSLRVAVPRLSKVDFYIFMLKMQHTVNMRERFDYVKFLLSSHLQFSAQHILNAFFFSGEKTNSSRNTRGHVFISPKRVAPTQILSRSYPALAAWLQNRVFIIGLISDQFIARRWIKGYNPVSLVFRTLQRRGKIILGANYSMVGQAQM